MLLVQVTIVYLASFLQWMFAELLFNKLQYAHVLTLDKKETYKGSSSVWDFPYSGNVSWESSEKKLLFKMFAVSKYTPSLNN